MGKVKTEPAEVWAEYEKGVSHKQSLGIYETVKKNEAFFVGNQWEGVNAPDLDKPVVNILKRVVSYFISTIVSDDVGAQLELFTGESDQEVEQALGVISAQFSQVIENTKMSAKNRTCVRNAAVDGDADLHIWYDPEVETGQMVTGAIRTEIIDNTNVIFANPQVWEVQDQPYLLLVQRKTVESAREEAIQGGMSEEEAAQIRQDDDPNQILQESDREDGKVTVIVKYWMERGKGGRKTVWAEKVTQNAVVRKPRDMGYRLYPVAHMSWDKIKNSCHGQSAITGLIPNQIFINKLFAMCMEHVKKMAFPKIVYNAQLCPGWSNRVGEAIPVKGDPNLAVANRVDGADMSSQVMMLIEKIINYTRDTMGASDSALGNVKPDNTSAIIATQKASAMPLELQRMDFYQFVEDYIRIFLDMMRVHYGVRMVSITDDEGEKQVPFDFGVLDGLHLKLNVEIGASTYWSELMQVQTTDNLFAQKIIDDPVLYLESIPDGYIKNKQKIIKALKDRKAQEQQAALMQGAAVPASVPAAGGMANAL